MGTLCSGAGNALDKADLLAALLRKAGHTVRYVHGGFDAAKAQQEILSMFGKPPGELPDWDGLAKQAWDKMNMGNLDPQLRAKVHERLSLKAAPEKDPVLLDAARDHWWVEMKGRRGVDAPRSLLQRDAPRHVQR